MAIARLVRRPTLFFCDGCGRPSRGSSQKIYGFRITPDFAGSATSLFDAYVGGNFTDPFKVRVGRFKPPFGLERLQSGSNLAFNERAFPTNLAPNQAQDVGVGVNWYLNRNVKLQVNYDQTSFDGGATAGADRIDQKVLFTRVQLALSRRKLQRP